MGLNSARKALMAASEAKVRIIQEGEEGIALAARGRRQSAHAADGVGRVGMGGAQKLAKAAGGSAIEPVAGL